MGRKPKIINKGERFGRLTVLGLDHRTACGSMVYLCLCDCGNVTEVTSGNLSPYGIKSCGCLRREVSGNLNRTHGLSKTKTYRSWDAMKQRCYNSNSDGYKYYGARGTKVCDRWLNSFENFLEDMGECPEGMEIDRILSNLDYCKDNCRWATHQVNMDNEKNTRTGNLHLTLENLTTDQLERLLAYMKEDR